jgi:hypothetical protein
MKVRSTAVAAVFCLLFSCAQNESKGYVDKSASAYRNTFDFVWDSAKAELKDDWQIQSENRKTATITTGWRLNLAPFSKDGRRDRLLVTIVGDGQSGWRASVKQETQMNAEEESPLDTTKAKWKDTDSDGALAAKFLQNLDMRLQPDERWRDRLAR